MNNNEVSSGENLPLNGGSSTGESTSSDGTGASWERTGGVEVVVIGEAPEVLRTAEALQSEGDSSSSKLNFP